MADIQKTPFIRELAASDRKTRDKALDSLTLFLRSRPDLSLADHLKIWKGLFFCFYHSDRPLTQQALARALSYSLVPSLPRQSRPVFLRAFWMTISREFHALDRLRLDKYLFLIRCYVGVGFEVLLKAGGRGGSRGRSPKPSVGQKQKQNGQDRKRKRGDDEEDADAGEWRDLQTYVDMLAEGPLSPINFDPEAQNDAEGNPPMAKGPDGLRYHLLDIWLDELEKVAAEPVEKEEAADAAGESDESEDAKGTSQSRLKDGTPLALILAPIERLRDESVTKTVRSRARDVLQDDRLVDWGFIEKKDDEDSEEDEDEDEEWGGID